MQRDDTPSHDLESLNFSAVFDILQEAYQDDPYFGGDKRVEHLFNILTQKETDHLTKEDQQELSALWVPIIQNAPIFLQQKIKNHSKFQVLLDYEALLGDLTLSEEKQIYLLHEFQNMHAVPDREILHKLIQLSGRERLQEVILTHYPSYLSRDKFLPFLSAATKPDIRELAIKYAIQRHDIPMKVFETMIADEHEPLPIRSLMLTTYFAKVSVDLFTTLILDQKEDLEFRTMALHLVGKRYDLSVDFLEALFLDPTQNLSLKKSAVRYLKDRLPTRLLHVYFVSETISIEEKYELLKDLSNRFSILNKDGTLDILVFLMKDFEKGRKLIIKSHSLSSDCIRLILYDPDQEISLKTEILNEYKQDLNHTHFKHLFNTLICDPTLESAFRHKLITDFPKLILCDSLIEIISNSDNPLEFQIALLLENKNKIRFGGKSRQLEPALLQSGQPFELKELILKSFYNYLSKETIIDFITQETQNFHQLQRLILSLKKLGFFTNHIHTLKQFIRNSRHTEMVMMIVMNFEEALTSENLRLIFRNHTLSDRDIEKFLLHHESRLPQLQILDFFLRSFSHSDALKKLIATRFFTSISGSELASILSDSDVSFQLKALIVQQNPLKHDLNATGELSFLLSDPHESPALKALVRERYGDIIKKH